VENEEAYRRTGERERRGLGDLHNATPEQEISKPQRERTR
jgi:hypothetical protein